MSHWHTPATRELPKPWDPAEWSRAQSMRANDLSVEDIAVALGRSRKAVKAKFQKEFLTPEQRQRRAEYQRRKRAENTSGMRNKAGVPMALPSKAPSELVAARDRRLATPPRDLTAAIFGDPLPGMSALDKQRQA